MFKRDVEPKDSLVAIAISVRTHEQKVIGILILTIKIDVMFELTKELGDSTHGLVYIIGSNGMLVAPPILDARR